MLHVRRVRTDQKRRQRDGAQGSVGRLEHDRHALDGDAVTALVIRLDERIYDALVASYRTDYEIWSEYGDEKADRAYAAMATKIQSLLELAERLDKPWPVRCSRCWYARDLSPPGWSSVVPPHCDTCLDVVQGVETFVARMFGVPLSRDLIDDRYARWRREVS
jgi:hypothetical protein